MSTSLCAPRLRAGHFPRPGSRLGSSPDGSPQDSDDTRTFTSPQFPTARRPAPAGVMVHADRSVLPQRWKRARCVRRRERMNHHARHLRRGGFFDRGWSSGPPRGVSSRQARRPGGAAGRGARPVATRPVADPHRQRVLPRSPRPATPRVARLVPGNDESTR